MLTAVCLCKFGEDFSRFIHIKLVNDRREHANICVLLVDLEQPLEAVQDVVEELLLLDLLEAAEQRLDE